MCVCACACACACVCVCVCVCATALVHAGVCAWGGGRSGEVASSLPDISPDRSGSWLVDSTSLSGHLD